MRSLMFLLIQMMTAWACLAQGGNSDHAPDWEAQAKKNLLGFKDLNNRKANVPVDATYLKEVRIESAKRMKERFAKRKPPEQPTEAQIADEAMRCVRKNNYWCIQNASKWPGVLGEDAAKHAVFERPEFSAQAKVSVMRRYYTRCNLKTLEQAICSYAPPDDCVGSKFGQDKDGRCDQHNDCVGYAKFVAARMKIAPDKDAKLFNAKGMATATLRGLMKHGPVMETGFFQPMAPVIERGIKLEAQNWKQLLKNQEERVKIDACPSN